MTDYVSIANAVKTTFEADAWLSNTSNLKTIETFERDWLFQGENFNQYFEESELPAVNIIPGTDKEQNFETIGEIVEEIQCDLIVESFHSVPLTAAQNHDELIDNLERVLSEQKTSAKDLGIDALVKNVSTETTDFKKGSNYFYQSIVTFIVMLTTDFQ